MLIMMTDADNEWACDDAVESDCCCAAVCRGGDAVGCGGDYGSDDDCCL